MKSYLKAKIFCNYNVSNFTVAYVHCGPHWGDHGSRQLYMQAIQSHKLSLKNRIAPKLREDIIWTATQKLSSDCSNVFVVDTERQLKKVNAN